MAVFASGLVQHSTVTTTETFLALVSEVEAKCGRNAPSTELPLKFVKSGYLPDQYIPTIRKAEL